MVMITCDAISVPLGRRTIVEQFSAQLDPGCLTGIIGPNGAGKSTLVRAMLGLTPLSGGAVLLDGAPLAGFGRDVIARKLAYLPQGQTLHWPLSVRRLVALGRMPHLGPMPQLSDRDHAAVDHAMARAHVLPLQARNAMELSGGERARVLLARALAVGAEGLVVDEPLASLDPGHQIDVMELLAQEARQGALVVAVLHDLTMAARYCDRLILMDRGCTVADGPPSAVLTPDNLARIYGVGAFIGGGKDTQTGTTVPMVVPLHRIAPS